MTSVTKNNFPSSPPGDSTNLGLALSPPGDGGLPIPNFKPLPVASPVPGAGGGVVSLLGTSPGEGGAAGVPGTGGGGGVAVAAPRWFSRDKPHC